MLLTLFLKPPPPLSLSARSLVGKMAAINNISAMSLHSDKWRAGDNITIHTCNIYRVTGYVAIAMQCHTVSFYCVSFLQLRVVCHETRVHYQ